MMTINSLIKLMSKTEIMLLLAVAAFSIALVIPITASGQTEVSGDIVNDVWTREGSPYLVTGNIRVIETLRIHLDVEVRFQGYYGIEVTQDALLTAEGGNVVEDRITFSSELYIWAGINFNHASNNCRISNCDISGAATALNCIQTDVHITGNRIDAHSVAINCNRASPIINYNYYIRVIGVGNAGSGFQAISIHDQSSPQIKGNYWIECSAFGSNTATAIYIRESSPRIEENWIEVVSERESKGIDAYFGDSVDILRNIIRARSAPIVRCLEFDGSTNIRVINNDIIIYGSPINNAIGLRVTNESSVNVINNIFYGNYASTGVWASAFNIDDSSGYNLYYNHDSAYRGILPLRGDIIDENPLFANDHYDTSETDYHVTWVDIMDNDTRSPCIDTGFPDESWNDRDDTRSDIGRFIYDGERPNLINESEEITPHQFDIYSVYPNPFNNRNNIIFNLPSPGNITVTLYDVYGHLIKTLMTGKSNSGMQYLNWSAQGLASGNYFITIKTDGMTQSKRVLYIP
ncbi:MAG: T9SS type A sorting domain-containing protein [Candidatus Hatepunaea meridiana]|nr:T9SS type A sorting domain-containing protein [Candidatus Hatepunaea meridiana]